jgi:hypothetical protein
MYSGARHKQDVLKAREKQLREQLQLLEAAQTHDLVRIQPTEQAEEDVDVDEQDVRMNVSDPFTMESGNGPEQAGCSCALCCCSCNIGSCRKKRTEPEAKEALKKTKKTVGIFALLQFIFSCLCFRPKKPEGGEVAKKNERTPNGETKPSFLVRLYRTLCPCGLSDDSCIAWFGRNKTSGSTNEKKHTKSGFSPWQRPETEEAERAKRGSRWTSFRCFCIRCSCDGSDDETLKGALKGALKETPGDREGSPAMPTANGHNGFESYGTGELWELQTEIGEK